MSSLHQFNPGRKSWKMYANEITSISGDDLTITPYNGKDLILEVSGNNEIIFKKGNILYNLADLSNTASSGGGGSLSIDVSTILIGDLSLNQATRQTASSVNKETDTFYIWEQTLTNNITYNNANDDYTFTVNTKGQYSLDILLRTAHRTDETADHSQLNERAVFYGFIRHYNSNNIFHDYILQGHYYRDDNNSYDSLAIGGQIILNLEQNDYFKIGIRTMEHNDSGADLWLSRMYSKMRIEKFVYTSNGGASDNSLTNYNDASFGNVDISGYLNIIGSLDMSTNINMNYNNINDVKIQQFRRRSAQELIQDASLLLDTSNTYIQGFTDTLLSTSSYFSTIGIYTDTDNKLYQGIEFIIDILNAKTSEINYDICNSCFNFEESNDGNYQLSNICAKDASFNDVTINGTLNMNKIYASYHPTHQTGGNIEIGHQTELTLTSWTARTGVIPQGISNSGANFTVASAGIYRIESKINVTAADNVVIRFYSYIYVGSDRVANSQLRDSGTSNTFDRRTVINTYTGYIPTNTNIQIRVLGWKNPDDAFFALPIGNAAEEYDLTIFRLD
jgi:hypothetical protein